MSKSKSKKGRKGRKKNKNDGFVGWWVDGLGTYVSGCVGGWYLPARSEGWMGGVGLVDGLWVCVGVWV